MGEALKETGTPGDVDFKLVDFGFRGVSSVESAAIGDVAHMVNFCSTDTVAGIVVAQAYYGAKMPGASIPASEHSTITSWTRDHEIDAMKNMLDKYKTGPVACVSDSYNIYDACTKKWGDVLKEQICKRDGVLVVRPDSGEPKEIVPELLGKLADAFAPGTCGDSPGTTTNDKGFKVLDPHVRLIQGDGINTNSVLEIIDKGKKSKQGSMVLIKDEELSADAPWKATAKGANKFAGKCFNLATVCHFEGDTKRALWASDEKGKAARADPESIGRVSDLSEEKKKEDLSKDLLVPVLRNGRVLKSYTLKDIRKRAASTWEGDEGCKTLQ